MQRTPVEAWGKLPSSSLASCLGSVRFSYSSTRGVLCFLGPLPLPMHLSAPAQWVHFDFFQELWEISASGYPCSHCLPPLHCSSIFPCSPCQRHRWFLGREQGVLLPYKASWSLDSIAMAGCPQHYRFWVQLPCGPACFTSTSLTLSAFSQYDWQVAGPYLTAGMGANGLEARTSPLHLPGFG